MRQALSKPAAMGAEEDPTVKEIEKCCTKWCTGRVEPYWIFLVDNKPTGSEHLPPYIYFSVEIFPSLTWLIKTPEHGCALQIKLSLHVFRHFRICSVDVIHPSFELAKAACTADTIAEGILDFITFGNGQTAPAKKRLFEP